uniref:Peptidase A2 domain-containing protein n=1 Tax=Hyaloperonospora arabidopsidis (strain Emoy2) TaxID=559515 RepID=M4BNF6_HYAAE
MVQASESSGKVYKEKATLLFNSGAETSIIDTTFARKPAETFVYQTKFASVWLGGDRHTGQIDRR